MSVPSSPSSSVFIESESSFRRAPAHEHHPEFSTTASSPDFDVVIVSSDDVHFIVSANLLKSTSTVFGDASGISQKSGADSDRSPVNINDLEASTISILLRMLMGKKLPDLGDLAVIEPLLFAAEKYGMDGPLSMMRNILKAQCHENPLRLYRIGCYFGTDIFSDQSRAALDKVLNNVNMPAVHILEIQDLHRQRINAVTEQAYIWAPDREGSILQPWGTKRCRTWYKFQELYDFQKEISTRIKESPAGHFISDNNFLKSYAAVNLREVYCSKCKCAHVNVKKILDKLGESLRRCPQEIRRD